MGSLRDNLLSALKALRQNWMRSALAMLGITIGVGSVVLLVSIGLGVKVDVTKQVESLGANLIVVVPGKLDKSGQVNMMSTLGISSLTQKDADDVRRIRGVRQAVPLMFVFGTLEAGSASASAIALAAPSAIQQVVPPKVWRGRFYRPDEERSRVCVLAFAPAEELFGTLDPIGRQVQVRGVPFTVIGVLEKEEESLFGSFNTQNVAYLPLEAVRESLKGGQINRIFAASDYNMSPEAVVGAVKRTLQTNHGGKEDFGVLTARQILGAIFKVFNIVGALLTGISAISLVVAGIGIMNIMLVTVTERTREIGIRKTVGARRRDIFQQFLTEAIILSVIGGTTGTLLAAAICTVVGRFTALKPLVTGGVIALAVGVCFLVGIVFGVAPAVRASRQEPIEALRWE
jgi:putative ABC transport system permease protein